MNMTAKTVFYLGFDIHIQQINVGKQNCHLIEHDAYDDIHTHTLTRLFSTHWCTINSVQPLTYLGK